MTSEKSSSLRTLTYFLKEYPLQNVTVIAALLLVGVVETLGIGALLPLIGMVVGETNAEASTTEQFVENVFNAIGLTPTLEVLLIVITGTIALKAIIMFTAMRYVGFVSADVSRRLRLQLIKSLMQAKWGYFSSLVTGHVSNAISEQAQRAGHCYTMAARATSALIQILVYASIAFLISFQISLLAVAMGGILAFCLKTLIRISRKAGQDMTNSMDSLLAVFSEALHGIKPIKAMAQEQRFVRQLEDDSYDVMRAYQKQHAASLSLQVVYEPVIVFLLACGLYYVLTFTDTSVNGVILLAFLFHRLMGQASLMQNQYQHVAQFESALWAMIKQIDAAEAEAEVLSTGKDVQLNEKITFANLDISYNGREFLFKNLSETIPAKQTTLLFGVSGIGKTTLTDVILGMHTPHSGQVSIDGTPMDKIDLKLWRKKIGYVPQDTFLFHDTIRQNVTLGNENYSDGDIENALKNAAAWDFTSNLPDGIETIVGERGGRLSGGQRQRIALARSLIRKPALLILDEATTGLDAESEKLVLQSIKALKGQTTVIMISHNPELKNIADTIIELKSGK